MAASSSSFTFSILMITSLLLPISSNSSPLSSQEPQQDNIPKSDVDLLEFPLNLEYLEAEFFLWGALGYGLDSVAPNLTLGGPPPIGVKKANLDPLVRDIITQFAYQEVGHLRAIKRTVPGFQRPLLDLSAKSFANVIDKAFGHSLSPPFDPYANGINFLIASYLVPYVGLTGYVGANPRLTGVPSKRVRRTVHTHDKNCLSYGHLSIFDPIGVVPIFQGWVPQSIDDDRMPGWVNIRFK